MYILIDPTSEEPAPNAHSVVRDTYQKYLNDRTTVRCIMLVAMSDEFSHRFENAQSRDMLQMLNESFCTLNDIERHKISCAIFNAQMREEASITDRVLYIIELIECLSKLGFFLHEQLQKDMILNSI